MNSGSAPQTTRSSTTIADEVDADGVVHVHAPARRRPWCRRRRSTSRAAGGGIACSAETSKRPAKPPRSPTTSGRCAARDGRLHQRDGALTGLDVDAGGGVGRGLPDSSTTSPDGRGSVTGERVRRPHRRRRAWRTPSASARRCRRRAPLDALEHVLAEQLGLGQVRPGRRRRSRRGRAGPSDDRWSPR